METFKVMNPDGTPIEGEEEKENAQPNFKIAAFLTKDALFGSQGGVDSVDAI